MITNSSNQITISKADKNDMQEILDLQYLAYQSEARLLNNYDIPPLKQSLVEVEIEWAEGTVLKAVDTCSRIIGSVRGRADGETLYIGKLIVHPDMQGQGIGSSLLAELENAHLQKRYELFTSTQSARNIKLYSRAGYKTFKKEQISDNLAFIYLEKCK